MEVIDVGGMLSPALKGKERLAVRAVRDIEHTIEHTIRDDGNTASGNQLQIGTFMETRKIISRLYASKLSSDIGGWNRYS